MNLSHWEQEIYLRDIDVIIIGSGIVGLNAALNLKITAPRLKVLVLERGVLPSGASTKNAGFACFGSVSELLDDLGRQDEDQVFSLVERRYKGLKRLRKNLGDKAMAYEALGGFEVFGPNDRALYEQCSARIEEFNRRLKKITGRAGVYKRSDRKIKSLGIKGIEHIIENTAEGQIHTGKMMQALIQRVHKMGVLILNGIHVHSFGSRGDFVSLLVNDGMEIKGRRLLICTNGFARQLLPGYPVTPARAQVMITSPVKNLRLKGAFHYDRGFYYFRNVGNRVLIGGGRNMDFKGEETTEAGLTRAIQEKLEAMLRNMIVPYADFTIESRWSGIMGVGPQKSPIIRQVNGNVYCAVRMGGMGVAIGSLVGEDAAKMILRSF
ncbi:MAG: FAD-dependent oxidoreductase [Bacteroidota bacterium]